MKWKKEKKEERQRPLNEMPFGSGLFAGTPANLATLQQMAQGLGPGVTGASPLLNPYGSTGFTSPFMRNTILGSNLNSSFNSSLPLFNSHMYQNYSLRIWGWGFARVRTLLRHKKN